MLLRLLRSLIQWIIGACEGSNDRFPNHFWNRKVLPFHKVQPLHVFLYQCTPDASFFSAGLHEGPRSH